MQVPPEQVEPGAQVLPQAPQFSGSVSTSTHEPAQLVSGLGHSLAHLDARHTEVPEHALPQPPQFEGSEVTSTHAAPHRVRPDSHPQLPAVHALDEPQLVLQEPQ